LLPPGVSYPKFVKTHTPLKKKRTPMMNTPPDAMQGNYKIKHKEKDARNVLGRKNEDKYV
jgi:hypothetical protein